MGNQRARICPAGVSAHFENSRNKSYEPLQMSVSTMLCQEAMRFRIHKNDGGKRLKRFDWYLHAQQVDRSVKVKQVTVFSNY